MYSEVDGLPAGVVSADVEGDLVVVVQNLIPLLHDAPARPRVLPAMPQGRPSTRLPIWSFEL